MAPPIMAKLLSFHYFCQNQEKVMVVDDSLTKETEEKEFTWETVEIYETEE